MGQVQGQGQCAGLTAGLWVKVLLGVLQGRRVRVRLDVLGMQLGGGITSASHAALGGQGWCQGREGGQLGGVLGRRNGGGERGREGGHVRRKASQDRAVGADDRLDAGHSVHRPERGETV